MTHKPATHGSLCSRTRILLREDLHFIHCSQTSTVCGDSRHQINVYLLSEWSHQTYLVNLPLLWPKDRIHILWPRFSVLSSLSPWPLFSLWFFFFTSSVHPYFNVLAYAIFVIVNTWLSLSSAALHPVHLHKDTFKSHYCYATLFFLSHLNPTACPSIVYLIFES